MNVMEGNLCTTRLEKVSLKSCEQFSLLRYRLAPADVFKSVGPKLVPFFKAFCIYFVAGQSEHSNIFHAIIKILPILCLCGFVLLQGVTFERYHDYSRRIFIGLILSAIGDICLVWKKQFFIHGMLAFALAHMSYMRAFGFQPLKPLTGIICFMITLPFYHIYFPNLRGLLVVAVPIYIVIISIMVWRAVTGLQAQLWSDEGLWRWTKLCSCLGAVTFGISDTIIGLHMFYFPVPYPQVLIMTTYYAGQLGIALSTFSLDDEYHLRMKHIALKQE